MNDLVQDFLAGRLKQENQIRKLLSLVFFKFILAFLIRKKQECLRVIDFFFYRSDLMWVKLLINYY